MISTWPRHAALIRAVWPDKSLERVILGFCCPLDETVVRKLLDMNGFTETEVVRAKMCQETYSIIV
jgi:hypothetical protein